MSTATSVVRLHQTNLLTPILIGGAIAGTLDQTSAFLTMGWNVPRNVAAGLLGAQVIHGSGTGVWVLGLMLHFLIAFSAAAIYCLASRKLAFLKKHWLVCGLFYGIAVYLVMYGIVMPLCAFHFHGPYTSGAIVKGVVVHMLLIGLPIAFSLRRWSE